MPSHQPSRRRFLQSTGTAALTLGLTAKAQSANEPIVLGIIGTGGRGKRLLRAITNLPQYRVAAVCDLIPEHAEQAAEICAKYKPQVRQYQEFRRMLDKENLDACIVATEESNHAKAVVPVLEAGLHCFSEKPMDTTVEKVDWITQTARQAKGIYQIGFQRRYVETFQKGMTYVHDGSLGPLSFLDGMWKWPQGVGGRYLDFEECGGWFLAQACHHVDVMQWVMQEQTPLRCVAMGAISQKTPDAPTPQAEDHSALVYEYPGNVLFSYQHVMNCCQEFSGEKLWVYGNQGGLDLRLGIVYPRPQGEPRQIAEGISDWDEGTYDELEAFAKHIRNNEKPLSNVETGRRSTLAGIMGRHAMYNHQKNAFEPQAVTWEDLGSKT